MHSFRRSAAVILGALAACGALLTASAPAAAAPVGAVAPSIVWADERLESVFGDPIGSSLRVPGLGELCDEPFACRIDLSARGGTFAPPPVQSLSAEPGGDGVAAWSVEGGTATLPAGTHRVDAALTLPDGAIVRTAAPLVLEVARRALEVAVRVDEDPGDRSGAVVAAQLGGEYLEIVNARDVGQPLRMPAGEWSVVLTDGEGAEVFAERRRIAAGGAGAVSWYWAGVPAGGVFTASATFAPAGEVAGNVAVREPAVAQFAAPEAESAPIVDITPTTRPEPTVGDSVPIPTGAVAVAGLVALVLLIVAIVLAVRLERRAATAGIVHAGGEELDRA